MAYRKRMSKRHSRKSFKRGLKTRSKNFNSGFVKRGGMRF